MNTSLKNAVIISVACLLGLVGGGARADETRALCQGGYNVMLMTPGECQYYLDKLDVAEKRADRVALQTLQEWHTELLIERAQYCPCQTSAAPMRRLDTLNVSALQSSRSARN